MANDTTTPASGYWKKIVNTSKSYLQKISGNSTNSTEDDTEDKKKDKESDKDKKIRRLREEFQAELEAFKNSTTLDVEDDKLNDAINRFQAYTITNFTNQGTTDGIYGSKNVDIELDSVVKADFILDHANSLISGKLTGLEKQLDYKKDTILRHTGEYEKENEFYLKVLTYKRYNPRHFTHFMAWFYCVLGFFMLVADLPISIGISKFFVVVPPDFEEWTFFEKMRDPEVLLFTLGITSLSIYFKVFFDEYVNTSIIKNEHQSRRFDAEVIVKLIFKLFILFALLFTLYNIAHLRSDLSKIPIEDINANVSLEQVLNFRFWSFIGATIMLPAISGICLSIGFGIFSNRANLNSAKKNGERSQKKIKEVKDEENKLVVKKALLEKIKEEWSQENRRKQIAAQFTSAYNQAFKRAHRIQFGSDLYEYATSIYMEHLSCKN